MYVPGSIYKLQTRITPTLKCGRSINNISISQTPTSRCYFQKDFQELVGQAFPVLCEDRKLALLNY